MVSPCSRGRLSPQHVAVVVAAIWLGRFAAQSAVAVDAPADDTANAALASERQSPGEPSPAEPLAKKQALSFAFVMLGCIIVGGAMLLALVVIWGNRTRRLAQSPLPPVAKRDELWFLKPKKEPPEGSAVDAPSDPDQETSPGK